MDKANDNAITYKTGALESPATVGAAPTSKAGPRNARAKGKRLGRPKVAVDAVTIGSLRLLGRSWREITEETGVSKGSAQRAFCSLPKNV